MTDRLYKSGDHDVAAWRKAGNVFAVVFLLGIAAEARATTCSWVATTADSWDNPSAWKYSGSSGCGSGSSVPDSNDDVVFNRANSGECNVNLDVTVQSITITNASNQGGIVANPTNNTIRVTGNWSQDGNSFNSNTASYPIGKLIVGGNFTQTNGTFKIPPVLAVGGTFSRSGGTFTSQTGSTVILTSTSALTHTLGGSSFANFAVNDNLIAYWKLDESADGSGAAGLDSSGWGNHVTYRSTPGHPSTTAPTNFTNPYAVSFAKVTGATTGEYADITTYPDTLQNAAWSISAWIKPGTATDTNGSEIISVGDDYGLRVETDGEVRVFARTTGGHKHCLSTNKNVLNGWHHVLGTYSGSTFTLYVDGVVPTLIDANSNSTCAGFAAQTWAGTALRIGGHPTNGNYDFDGTIDDVRIYNRVLTATEAAMLATGAQINTGTATQTLSGTLTTTGDLIIGSGNVAGTGAIDLTGSWFNYGGGYTGTGLVSFLGTTSGYKIRSSGQVFNAITFNGASGGWTLEQNADVAGVTTLTNGTLDASSYTLRTANITKTSGTFTASSSTAVIGSSGSSGNVNLGVTSLNNLRVEDPTETNLVAYWKLDTAESTYVHDWSGTGWLGTLVNGPTWKQTGLPGVKFYNPAALTFDGSNDYVQISGTTFKNPVTVSAWIYRTADGTLPRILVLPYLRFYATTVSAGATGGIGLLQDCPSGTDGDWASSSGAYTYNAWHHVAATYDASNTGNAPTFYIDGNAVSRSQTTGPNQVCLSGSGTGYIGSAAGSNPFTGSIDDVRVYDAVLSAAQIAALAAGRYPNTGGTATVTLSANSTVGKKLTVDSGTLSTSSYTLAAAGSDTTQGTEVWGSTLALGSATTTLNGGLTVGGGSTVTGSSGALTLGHDGTHTLEVYGNITSGSGTVTLGAKETTVYSGGTYTVGGGNTVSAENFTVNGGGTLLMNTTSGQVQVGNTKYLTVNGTLQTTTGTATPKPKITSISGRVSFQVGSAAGTPVLNIDGLAIQNTGTNGLYIDQVSSSSTTFTSFKNIDFLGTTSGSSLLRIDASSLNIVGDALTFDASNITNNVNVRLVDRDATPSGSDVRAFFGATCTISSAASDCEAYDWDADTGNDNKADDTGNGGAVAFWGLRGHTDLAGTIEGFPSASFDWSTFAHWRTYAVYNNASGAVDRLYARDDDTYTDGRAGYYWDLSNGENFVGSPRWTTESGNHYVYVLTTLGNVYKLRDTGSAFVAVASPWDTPYRHTTGGTSATATSPLIMDASNNLYWAGNNGGGSARLFSLSAGKSLNNEFSISSNTINAVPALATYSGSTYLYAVTNLNGANGGIYRILSDFSDSARNAAPTADVSGRVTVVGAVAYILDTKGKMWTFDSTSSSLTAGWYYQDTGTTNHAASCASDANCLAKNMYLDPATSRVYWGDKDGHVYGVYNNAGTGTTLTGFPFRPGSSSDVFETAPLFRSLGTNLGSIIVIGAQNGNVYFIDRYNGSTGPAMYRKYEFGSAVSSISYDRNSSTDGEYMIATANGRLYYISSTWVPDPTPTQN
jgi:hypothetical protein